MGCGPGTAAGAVAWGCAPDCGAGVAGRAGSGGGVGGGAAAAGRGAAAGTGAGRAAPAADTAAAGSLRPRRFLSANRVCREIPLSVSNTPTPVTAEASNQGQSLRLRAAFISSRVQMSARSRLLYWRTRGRVSDDSPISIRFSSRLRNDSTLACTIARCESATKTTPSTPLSTSLRVVL